MFAIKIDLKHDQEPVFQHDSESSSPHCQISPVSQPESERAKHHEVWIT